jgi:IS1 family transposase
VAGLSLNHYKRSNKNDRLQNPNNSQYSCKSFDFPLYIDILSGLLFYCLIWLGEYLYLVRGQRRRGAFVTIIGACLLFSMFTAIGFCDPIFWRAEWRSLTGKGANRCGCESENRQEFPHNLAIVPQKHLDSPVFMGYSNYMANVLNIDKQIAIIGALTEGSSIRSIERMTGVHRDTIMRLGVRVGQGCTALMDAKMVNLPCQRLEVDEIWGFVGKKQRNVKMGEGNEVGSVWTWCAIDADTKLVPAFKVGERNSADAKSFMQDVAARLAYRVQLSSDGFHGYAEAVRQSFGQDVDYAQIVKVYGTMAFGERKYSTNGVLASTKAVYIGQPDKDLISTSYIERLNATTRLHMRRLTRLTLAFSKKRENFEAAVGLHFAFYNFVKRHNTVKTAPAVAAGVTDKPWSIGELLEATA